MVENTSILNSKGKLKTNNKIESKICCVRASIPDHRRCTSYAIIIHVCLRRLYKLGSGEKNI